MKKSIKIIYLILVFNLIFSAHYSCLAANTTKKNTTSNKTINTSILTNSFVDDLNPEKVNGIAEDLSTPFVNFIHKVVNPILGFIQVIGGILTVVSIALFGLGMLLTGNPHLAGDLGLGMMGGPGGHGGPDEKIRLLEFGRHLLIGAVLLFFSATLVKFVFYIFNG